MPITYPVSKTTISTTQWGIPVTDEVNRLTAALAAMTPTAWVSVTLQNGWTHAAGAPLQYRKIGDNVQLRGRADKPTGSAWETVTVLPVGFRPPGDVMVGAAIVIGSTWTSGAIQINSGGLIIPTINMAAMAPVTMFSILPTS